MFSVLVVRRASLTGHCQAVPHGRLIDVINRRAPSLIQIPSQRNLQIVDKALIDW